MNFIKNIKLLFVACFGFLPFPVLAQTSEELVDKADKEYKANNFQAAADLATRAINLKASADAYLTRADSRFELKDYEGALADFDKLLSAYSDFFTTDKYKGTLYYWKARCKQKLARYNDAIADFSSSLDHNTDALSYWNRAFCYYSLEKFKESDDDFAKTIELVTDTTDLAELYRERGDCYNRLHEYNKAEQFYNRSVDFNAAYPWVYVSRGYCRHRQSKNDEAIADYTKAISLCEAQDKNSRDIASIYRNMAILYNELHRNEDALQAINRSIQTDPNYIPAFETRLDIYKQVKNYAKAKSEYNNLITLAGNNKAISDLYFHRAYELQWVTLDYKGALEDLNKSIELDPKDAIKYWYRAITYDRKKDYPKAIADIGMSIQLYGDNVSSGLYSLRASIEEKTGDINGALSDCQAALKLKAYDYTYYKLGRLLKTRLKNDELGDMNLAKAIELAKDDGRSGIDAFATFFKTNSKDAVALVLEKTERYKNDSQKYCWQLHNTAVVYALAGDITKALEYLDRALAAGFDDYNYLINNNDLISLTLLPQYKIILEKYKVPQPKW